MKKFRTVTFVLTCLVWQSANATNLNCEGEVQQILIGSVSNVQIVGSWHTSWTQICVLDNAWNGISAETCKSWVSMALAAYHAKSTVWVQYANVSAATCATLPTYGASDAPATLIARP